MWYFFHDMCHRSPRITQIDTVTKVFIIGIHDTQACLDRTEAQKKALHNR